MDLVTTIKDTISDIAIENLAGYLGEDINGTRLGLDLGIGTFLAGVIKFASTDKTGRSLLGILNDGGHTGDILNNFEIFSGKPEKARLLETIGGNIVNHFLQDKSDSLADKMAGQADIKISSASALLNLSAPLVLGFLGKMVREKNMSAHDLKAYLGDATGEVSSVLPSSLLLALNLPKYSRGKSSPLSHYQAVKELNKDEKRKGENWSMILPWVFLFFVGIMIWYFSRSKENAHPSPVTETVQPEIFLPQDTLVTRPSEPVSPARVAADTVRVIPVQKNTEPAGEKKPETVSRKEPETESRKEQETQKEEAEDTTPAGFNRVPASVFARNSAEVVSGSALDQLLASLKEGRRKLVLTPLQGSGAVAVDRAYAIRDYLLENGVELSQVEIASPGKGRNPSGVAYRINH